MRYKTTILAVSMSKKKQLPEAYRNGIMGNAPGNDKGKQKEGETLHLPQLQLDPMAEPVTKKRKRAAEGECFLCVEPFNLTKRRLVLCGCGFGACHTCVARYITESSDTAKCMDCKRAWDQRFLAKNMTRKFVTKDYKNHKQDIFLNRQKALLPMTLQTLEEIEDGNMIAEDFRQMLCDFLEETKNMGPEDVADIRNRLYQLKRQVKCEQIRINAEHERYANARDAVSDRMYRDLFNLPPPEPEPVPEENSNNNNNGEGSSTGKKKKKIKTDKELFGNRGNCREPGCEGLIMRKWICVRCETKKCSRCHESIKTDPADHECDENNVASVKAVIKSTRPCPSCRAPIHRSAGCAQMFCTQCLTFFDYRTGEKLNPRFAHNPEYNQMVRDGKIEDVRGNGNGNLYEGYNGWNRHQRWYGVHIAERFAMEFQEYGRATCRDTVKRMCSKMFDMRVSYIRGNIKQDGWKKKVQEIEKKKFFHRDAFELVSTFVATVLMMTQAECWATVSPEEKRKTLDDLQATFQTQKNALCKWYSYSQRELIRYKGGNGRYYGREPVYY